MINPKACTNNDNSHEIIIASGKKTLSNSPWMQLIKKELLALGYQVDLLDLMEPFSEENLIKQWKEKLDSYSSTQNLFIGGKSQGGRIAALLANQYDIKGTFTFGYPFYNATIKDLRRVIPLFNIYKPTLILQGEVDQYGQQCQIERILFPQNINLQWIKNADHSLTNQEIHIVKVLDQFIQSLLS